MATSNFSGHPRPEDPSSDDWSWGWILGLIVALLLGIVLCHYVGMPAWIHQPAWRGMHIFPLPRLVWILLLVVLILAALVALFSAGNTPLDARDTFGYWRSHRWGNVLRTLAAVLLVFLLWTWLSSLYMHTTDKTREQLQTARIDSLDRRAGRTEKQAEGIHDWVAKHEAQIVELNKGRVAAAAVGVPKPAAVTPKPRGRATSVPTLPPYGQAFPRPRTSKPRTYTPPPSCACPKT